MSSSSSTSRCGKRQKRLPFPASFTVFFLHTFCPEPGLANHRSFCVLELPNHSVVFGCVYEQCGHALSKAGQMMVVRAIAVAIVLEGTMLPNQELLLRHAIQYFSLRGSSLLAVRKARLVRLFILMMIISPRQTRDKYA